MTFEDLLVLISPPGSLKTVLISTRLLAKQFFPHVYEVTLLTCSSRAGQCHLR